MKKLLGRLVRARSQDAAPGRGSIGARRTERQAYDAESYWGRRHARLQGGFRSVGNQSLTEEDNVGQYKRAAYSFLELLEEAGVDPYGKRVLDIGCGNGFWSGVFQRTGVVSYLGIDVTDVLFDQLRTLYPGFEFRKNRIFELDPEDEYDLITMIDVTQHITDAEEFQATLQAAKARLASDGVIILTTWNEDTPSGVNYEVKRRVEDYERELSPLARTELRPFRDKYITAFSTSASRERGQGARRLDDQDLEDLIDQMRAAS